MKTFLRYVRPSTLMIIIGLTIKFIATICDLVIPSVLATLIDDVAPTGNTAAVWRWGALMFGVTVLAVVTNISANFMAAHTAGRITRALRRDLFEKISSLSARQIDSFTVPSLISRMTSDTYNVSQMAAKLQRIGFRAPVILIGGIIVTLFLDPVLTLMLLACLPAIAVIVFLVTKYGIPMGCILYPENPKFLNEDFRRLRMEFLSKEANSRQMQNLYIEELLIRLSRELSRKERTGVDENLQTKLCSLRVEMLSQPEKKWSVEELAHRVSLSPSRFHVGYRAIVGMLPVKDLILARIDRAKLLLLEEESSTLAEIAEKLGYKNPYDFCRQFTKVTGISPGSYRKTHQS